jgi:D-glycero-D-manno-heptose 1,7-bisphosphate phosphatase
MLNQCILIKSSLQLTFLPKTMKNKALFLDRDGVINTMVLQKNGVFDSPQTVEQVTLVQDIDKVIAFCNQKNIPVIEITNQPGVAKGKMGIDTLDAIEARIHFLLKEKNTHIDFTYRCLHHPHASNLTYKDNCLCRKPKPGLLIKASHEANIELSTSLFVGDNVSDMEAGKSAGCRTILLNNECDEPHKVILSKEFQTLHRVTSHKETLELIKKLL